MAQSRLVFSTEGNNTCPRCNKALHKCRCTCEETLTNNDGVVRLQRESKGRGGKQVTVIKGLPGLTDDLKKLLKQLKTLCGSGGTLKAGTIEIQGEHLDLLKTHLEKQGHTVKISGG